MPEEIIKATHELAEKVEEFNKSLTISEALAAKAKTQAERTEKLGRWVAGLAVLTFFGVIVTGILLVQVRHAVGVNKANAVTGCQNANESRAGQRLLWGFLLNINTADRTPEERAQAAAVVEWINELFAARDCSDLDRKYPLPDPPKITP